MTRTTRIYATLRRSFCMAELQRLGFRPDGSAKFKRGARRFLLATASSLDGRIWRVTPLVRHWR